MILDTANVKMLQQLITRMIWIDYRLEKVDVGWNKEELMAVKPSRKQRKQISDTCLTESTLRKWLKIEASKIPIQMHHRVTHAR